MPEQVPHGFPSRDQAIGSIIVGQMGQGAPCLTSAFDLNVDAKGNQRAPGWQFLGHVVGIVGAGGPESTSECILGRTSALHAATQTTVQLRLLELKLLLVR